MKIQRHHQYLLTLTGMLVSGAALAHPGHGIGAGINQGGVFAGLGAGFVHPFTGLDHLLAMLAVGLWAAQQGGRARWALPLTFLGTLAGGAVLGLVQVGTGLASVEPLIAASVLVLGFLISLSARIPLAVSASLVGLFGVWHGYAHGSELASQHAAALPATAFFAGFLLASALLHAAGLLVAGLLQGGRVAVLRLGGAAIGFAGILLLALA